jgi:hypothetical protein
METRVRQHFSSIPIPASAQYNVSSPLPAMEEMFASHVMIALGSIHMKLSNGSENL